MTGRESSRTTSASKSRSSAAQSRRRKASSSRSDRTRTAAPGSAAARSSRRASTASRSPASSRSAAFGRPHSACTTRAKRASAGAEQFTIAALTWASPRTRPASSSTSIWAPARRASASGSRSSPPTHARQVSRISAATGRAAAATASSSAKRRSAASRVGEELRPLAAPVAQRGDEVEAGLERPARRARAVQHQAPGVDALARRERLELEARVGGELDHRLPRLDDRVGAAERLPRQRAAVDAHDVLGPRGAQRVPVAVVARRDHRLERGPGAARRAQLVHAAADRGRVARHRLAQHDAPALGDEDDARAVGADRPGHAPPVDLDAGHQLAWPGRRRHRRRRDRLARVRREGDAAERLRAQGVEARQQRGVVVGVVEVRAGDGLAAHQRDDGVLALEGAAAVARPAAHDVARGGDQRLAVAQAGEGLRLVGDVDGGAVDGRDLRQARVAPLRGARADRAVVGGDVVVGIERAQRLAVGRLGGGRPRREVPEARRGHRPAGGRVGGGEVLGGGEDGVRVVLDQAPARGLARPARDDLADADGERPAALGVGALGVQDHRAEELLLGALARQQLEGDARVGRDVGQRAQVLDVLLGAHQGLPPQPAVVLAHEALGIQRRHLGPVAGVGGEVVLRGAAQDGRRDRLRGVDRQRARPLLQAQLVEAVQRGAGVGQRLAQRGRPAALARRPRTRRPPSPRRSRSRRRRGRPAPAASARRPTRGTERCGPAAGRGLGRRRRARSPASAWARATPTAWSLAA